MRVLPFEKKDLAALSGFQPPGWSDICAKFAFYLDAEFCKPMKAVDGTALTGVGCTIQFGSTAWLGHMIVHPEHRRRGIASEIMDHVLRALEQAGVCTVSLVATEAGYPVYQRFGFIDDCEYLYLERTTAPADKTATSDAAMTSAASPGDYDAILHIDRLVSGEEREALLLPHLAHAVVVRETGPVSGVYFPTLGEGLVEAMNPAAGANLLRHRAVTHSRTVIPADNPVALDWLRHNEYTEMSRAMRMHRGRQLDWRPECLFGRIGGNLG